MLGFTKCEGCNRLTRWKSISSRTQLCGYCRDEQRERIRTGQLSELDLNEKLDQAVELLEEVLRRTGVKGKAARLASAIDSCRSAREVR